MCPIKQVFLFFIFILFSETWTNLTADTFDSVWLKLLCWYVFLWRLWWRNLLLKSEYIDLLTVHKYPRDIFGNFRSPATYNWFLELTREHNTSFNHLWPLSVHDYITSSSQKVFSRSSTYSSKFCTHAFCKQIFWIHQSVWIVKPSNFIVNDWGFPKLLNTWRWRR